MTVTSLVPTFDHATYYPGARDILVKLVAEKSTGRLLGGQAVGTGDTAKRIDVLATALTFGATVNDLANLDLAYAPPYNSAMDPLHNAANVIRNKLAGHARSLTPPEVKKKLENGEHFILLDVRSPMEWKAERIEAEQVKLIPLPELRQRIGELSKDEEIVVLCRTSIRAYQAQRILDGAGFKNVKFMDGSLAAWPYNIISVKLIPEATMDIGFIGIGQMGKHMANRILEAGYKLTVHDINKEAAAPLIKKGAKWGDTPEAVAKSCRIVITSLPTPQDVEAGGLRRKWPEEGMASRGYLHRYEHQFSFRDTAHRRRRQNGSNGAGRAGKRRRPKARRTARWRSWWGAMRRPWKR